MSRTKRATLPTYRYLRRPKTIKQLRQITGILADKEFVVRNRDRGFKGSRYVSNWDDILISARGEIYEPPRS